MTKLEELNPEVNTITVIKEQGEREIQKQLSVELA